MPEPIEEVYFKWLYSKVASTDHPTPSSSYWTLLRELHLFEFVWLLPGDDNRAEDGLDIRKEFLLQARTKKDPSWEHVGCSVLEMLIAFSRKAEFNTEISARDWFWIFLANLGIDQLSDSSMAVIRKVNELIFVFVWRTYRRNGEGGLFPLKKSRHDQRKVEIWYQFCEYLIECESE